MVTRTDYNQIAVKAAYSVLLEIIRILGEYKDNIVLIGGWVPQFLFQNEDDWHTGSIDVDLAIERLITSGLPTKSIKASRTFFWKRSIRRPNTNGTRRV